MSLRLALVLLLTCLSFPLMARDVRHLGPDDGSACDDATQADDAAATATPARPSTHPARTPARPRPPAVRSSGDGVGEIRPPRWHSFLPGMFR